MYYRYVDNCLQLGITGLCLSRKGKFHMPLVHIKNCTPGPGPAFHPVPDRLIHCTLKITLQYSTHRHGIHSAARLGLGCLFVIVARFYSTTCFSSESCDSLISFVVTPNESYFWHYREVEWLDKHHVWIRRDVSALPILGAFNLVPKKSCGPHSL